MKNIRILVLCISLILTGCAYLPLQNTFENNTYLSNVRIEGMTEEEVKAMLASKIEDWKQQSTITLIYQNKSFTLPSSVYTFYIDKTISQLQNNRQNDLIVSLDTQILREWLQQELMPSQYGSIQFKKLEQDLIQIVQKLDDGDIYMNVKEYVDESSLETVASSRIIVPLEMTDFVTSFVEAHEQISITGYETFSLHSWVELSTVSGTDEEWSFLGTAMYKVILQSNFQILKRTAHRILPTYATLGQDVKVTASDYDFVFHNPNEENYAFQFEQDGDRLYIDLIGQPFKHTYKVEVDNIEYHEVNPVVRYTDDMDTGIYYVEQKGYAAVSLDVYRIIYGENGELSKKEKVSHEFYPAVSGIEVHGTREVAEVNPVEEQLEEGQLSIVTEDEFKIYIEEIVEEAMEQSEEHKVVNES
ncbi:VanW family protein [Bacillus kexueae]|uniref:VanW family protein n=1 Tax=Aeribacillus kexueae TaxID=2078952 RepID=UPI001FAF6F08|nr:VanW family protein [Bacillus kexueae]